MLEIRITLADSGFGQGEAEIFSETLLILQSRVR